MGQRDVLHQELGRSWLGKEARRLPAVAPKGLGDLAGGEYETARRADEVDPMDGLL